MCGIAGIFNLNGEPVSPVILRAMTDAIAHRGPDGEGFMHSVTDEVRYRLLRYLEEHPKASQRELARELGISVGKANYCLHALVRKGLVKIRSFRRSKNKLAYAYVLTPAGIQEKIDLTYAFLKRKVQEYDLLKSEIRRLRGEVGKLETSSRK